VHAFTILKARGIKVKVFSKDCMWHVAFMCWFINLTFAYFTFKIYKYVLDLNIFSLLFDHTSHILYVYVLCQIKMNKFC
jgi:hypothetical protein